MPRDVQSRGYGKKLARPRKARRKPAPSFNKQVARKISAGVKYDKARPKAAPYSMLDTAKGKSRPKHATKKYVKRAEKQTKTFHKTFVKIPKRQRLEGVVMTGGNVVGDRQGRPHHVDRTGYVLRSSVPHFAGDTATRKELAHQTFASLDKHKSGFQRAMTGPASVRLALAPYHVARATVEDPLKVIPATGKGVRDMIVGLPSAAVKSVTDPKGALKDLTKDYSRRYGPLAEGDTRKFRERIKKEGAASEIADIGGAAAVEGRILGVGSKATRTVRPKLKRSGGPAVEQVTSRNFNTAVAQHALDRRRAKKTVKAKRVVDEGGRVPALDVSLAKGEVAPLRRSRPLGDRQVAARKSRGVQAMKAEQGREVHKGATRALAGLDRHERKGFKYAMQLGIRNPQTAVAHLSKHRERIVANREALGTDIPKSLRKTNDELPRIDALLENPDRVFTPRLAKVVEAERRRGNRVQKSDPGLATEQALLRRYAPQAEHLDVVRKEGEKTPAFVKRVRAEAEKTGLTKPAYFSSQKRPTASFSARALGGTKAVVEDKAYTGALFRTGREDVRTGVHTQALAKNIKRKHNWNTVADNFDANAFAWGKNKTISQIENMLDAKGIDRSSVAFWNPRKYREVRKNTEGSSDAAVHGDDIAPPGLDKAVDEAAIHDLSTKGDDFKNTKGWSVIPKQVYDEIHAETRPSGAGARSWDVFKGKQSRVLLGTNPPWLAFQVGSNALLTGLAKTGPIDAVKAQIWWRKLDPKLREDVEPLVGVGAHYMDVQQPKLGAAANNQMVNAYRAFKEHPAMQRLSKVNPLDAMFKADNAQNNFFRKSVLYSQAKRDAYRQMGKNVGQAHAMQARTHGLFTLGPKAQIEGVLKNKAALERHAGYVNDMLGDYLTYTAKERRILGRSVMFYGFMRYSLKFAFHTMPIKHPVMTAIIANLGRMQTDEVRRLLGGDELPFALGKLYITKDGKLQEINLARLNPASNQLVEALGNPRPLGKFISSLPPIVGTALDLAFEKTGFTGKPIKVEGEHNYAALDRQAKGLGIGTGNAGRVAASRILRLVFPYRVWEGVEYQDVPQGDDSLAFSKRPTKFKDEEIRADIAKARKRQQAKGTGGILKEELLPFLPKPTRDPELAKQIRAKRRGTTSGGDSGVTRGQLSGGGSGGSYAPGTRGALSQGN